MNGKKWHEIIGKMKERREEEILTMAKKWGNSKKFGKVINKM